MAVALHHIQVRIRGRAWLLAIVLVPLAAAMGWQIGKALWFHVMVGSG